MRKLENVLGPPENKNREKRVWAIAQKSLYPIFLAPLPPHL
jgi:hypothetical protein